MEFGLAFILLIADIQSSFLNFSLPIVTRDSGIFYTNEFLYDLFSFRRDLDWKMRAVVIAHRSL